MKDILLIGNGLNRALDNAAWEDILDILREKYDVSDPDQYHNFPLEYERIYSEIAEKRVARDFDIKKDIANSLHPLTNDALLRDFTALPVDEILTSNYDYNIEKAVQPDFDEKTHRSSTTETKHSLFRYTQAGNRRIWHVHGEKRYPKTICIGYEQYCSYLSRMHEFLTKPATAGRPPYLFDQLQAQDGEVKSWTELFFTANIHIVGLTMSFMEIDLWWLLSYRRRLMLENPKLGIRNQIHYYYPDGKCDPEQISLMDSMGVILHTHPLIRKNWTRMYGDILASLKTALSAK